jgi:hypothetical protein
LRSNPSSCEASSAGDINVFESGIFRLSQVKKGQ